MSCPIKAWIRLRSLSQDFARLQNQLEKERDLSERLTLQNAFLAKLVNALGFDWQPTMKNVGDFGEIPVLSEVANGLNPALWAIGVLNGLEDKDDPLNLKLLKEQWLVDHEAAPALFELTCENLINKVIFGLDNPPRWVLLISDAQLLLIDRSKWHEKRLLRFDLTEIFGRREDSTFKAVSALLFKEHLTPKYLGAFYCHLSKD